MKGRLWQHVSGQVAHDPALSIVGSLAPANADEMDVAEHELLEGAPSWSLGDRTYWRPAVTARLRERGIALLAPYKWASREREPWPQWLTDTQRRIETVICQLTERYRAK